MSAFQKFVAHFNISQIAHAQCASVSFAMFARAFFLLMQAHIHARGNVSVSAVLPMDRKRHDNEVVIWPHLSGLFFFFESTFQGYGRSFVLLRHFSFNSFFLSFLNGNISPLIFF